MDLCSNRTREQITPIKGKDDLVKRYPDCFDGVGKFQGQYHITMDPSEPPVVHAQRRVPLSLRDDIKDGLDDTKSRGIITKIKRRQANCLSEQPPVLQETEWLTQNMNRPQGSKQSYFQRALFNPYSRRNSPKTKWCQVLLHSLCEMWLLEHWARPRIELFNRLQFTIWPLQISAMPFGL